MRMSTARLSWYMRVVGMTGLSTPMASTVVRQDWGDLVAAGALLGLAVGVQWATPVTMRRMPDLKNQWRALAGVAKQIPDSTCRMWMHRDGSVLLAWHRDHVAWFSLLENAIPLAPGESKYMVAARLCLPIDHPVVSISRCGYIVTSDDGDTHTFQPVGGENVTPRGAARMEKFYRRTNLHRPTVAELADVISRTLRDDVQPMDCAFT